MPLDQIDVDRDMPDYGNPQSQGSEQDQKEMSFLDHLEELRWHLIRSAISIIVIAIAVFAAGRVVFEKVVLAPKEPWFVTYQVICSLSERLCFTPPDFDLMTIALGEQFIVHLKVSVMLGIVVAFPYILFEIWRFIKPGLYPNEQKAARGFVTVCSFLFFFGVSFGYFIVSPFAVTFLAGYNVGAVSSPSLASFVNYMTMFTVPTGVVFELPVIVFFLSKIGLLYPEFMRTYRRHAFVLILILAAIITPPDVVTQFLIGVPLYALYEISIIVCKRVVAQNEKAANS
ncbi:MAG: twin-arginine translocase subunit TatC [Bacteroidota bacterium]